ncbi:MAG: D-alanyl-D-alanine carboxypeptidase/D-alanyl-D-alanine-endopeptidase [Bryobacteraceae bacterium]|jgi:D-alanyl-D-alanine carboxypeptidase/D-alanyl-D-alanine-endopeptidase (penicillin-binding protein 4)
MKWFPILLLTAAATAASPKPGNLGQRIERMIRSSPVAERSFWGVEAVQVATGKPLVALNQRRLFTPASNTKLFTTAVALTELGPAYRFETIVTCERAPDASGRLVGDLRLVGGGDPSLDALEGLADQVVASGVRRIEGDILGDDTAYVWEPYAEGWAQDDTLWDYGAPVSALAVNDNLVTLRVRAAGKHAAVAFSPPLDYYAVDNRVRTGPRLENKVHVERLPGSRQLRLWGTLDSHPPGETQFLLAIDDPALYAACALADALTRRGVAIAGRPVALHRYPNQREGAPDAVVLARRSSPPLVELLRIMDKVSQNLFAEMFLREVARQQQGAGTRAAGIETMRRFLAGAGIAADEYNFTDGSGLSGSNLVTPEAVVKLLRHMHESKYRETWMSLLPVGGQDGTLAARFEGEPAARRVHAKTGTLTHASALSGYVQSASRGTLAFSILANNYRAPAADVRALIDRIALALAE